LYTNLFVSGKKASALVYDNKELFDTLASIYVVKDEQANTDLANDSDFGLGACLFTQDIERGKRIANKIDTGKLFINHST
jgi:succinate-semialdehyde dehydrogenase/glutarate-semialdehyde dehydrogenase